MSGCVYWITGLSGAGKTTLATALQKKLPGSTLLDGDVLRGVLGCEHSGFDRAGRLALALTYARLCKLLAEQGQTVIIATISLFHEVHSWNREHLPGYREIYLDVSEEIRRSRDAKGLYAGEYEGKITHMAGTTTPVEIPLHPDIVLSAALTVNDAVNIILGSTDETIPVLYEQKDRNSKL